MKEKLLQFVSASVFALAGTAVAGQPLKLSDAQMDRVAAGAVGSAIGLADAVGNLQAQTVALTLGSADSAHGNALAMGLSAASASSLLSPAVASSLSAAIAKAP
jgi:electron transfer flavoprotein alpha/beta subunit